VQIILKFSGKKSDILYITDREKEFIKSNKRFLNLNYQKSKYDIAGEKPPDDLLWEIYNIERHIRLISHALD
jgi:hypothetical protein